MKWIPMWVHSLLAGLAQTNPNRVSQSKEVSPSRHIFFEGSNLRPTVVFVHGIYHGSWAFRDFSLSFRKRGFPAALVDLRGHWGTPRVCTSSRVGYSDYQKDLVKSLDSLNGPKVVVGHSLGGLLALSIPSRDDIIGKVLMATPLPDAIRKQQLRLIFKYPAAAAQFLISGDASSLYHNPSFTERYFFSAYTEERTKRVANGLIQQQLEPRRFFKDITRLQIERPKRSQPTLILFGSDDPTVTSRVAGQLADLSGGKVVMIPRAGHDIMLEETAGIASSAIIEWLEQLSIEQ